MISFIPLSANDLIKPDTESTIPDKEALKIDFDSIRKNIKPDKSKLETSNISTESEKKKVTKVKTSKTVSKEKKKKASAKKNKTASKKGKSVLKKVKVKSRKGETDTKKVQTDTKTEKIDIKALKTNTKSPDKDIITSNNNLKTKDSDVIIINPLKAGDSRNRLYFFNYSELIKLSRPDGLKVYKDSPPVIDELAFFTPDYYAEFRIDGYDRNLIYRLIIDFVQYKGDLKPMNSILKIWGRNITGKMFLISELDYRILTQQKLFETLIPYELSSYGRFDIIVREYSDSPGKWGIWDIIVTDKRASQLEIVKPDASEKIKDTKVKIFE